MTGRPTVRRAGIRRWLPLAAIVALIAAAFASGAHEYVTLSALRENREWLEAHVAASLGLAAATFIVLYAAATAASLPTGTVLTLTGGFLFGPWIGALLTVTGATIGAVGIFLAASTALGGALKARLEKSGGALAAMEKGFREDALFYLLFLRLTPIFPFFVVNLAPAFLGVRLPLYAWTTFVGIFPGTLVYTFIGAGLGKALEGTAEPSLENLVSTEILLGLGGLGAMSLLAVVVRRVMRRRSGGA